MVGSVGSNHCENFKLSYLSYNFELMKTVGLWPLNTDSSHKKHFYNLYKVALAISLLTVSVLQVVQIIISPNIAFMASAIDLATLTSAALFRMVYFIVYNEDFKVLIGKVNGLLVEENRFPISQPFMSVWMRKSNVLSTIFIASISIVFCVFFIFLPYLAIYFPSMHSPLLNRTLEFQNKSAQQGFLNDGNRSNIRQLDAIYFETHSSARSTVKHLTTNMGLDYEDDVLKSLHSSVKMNYEERHFPLNCWFPYDVTQSPAYEVVLFLEIFPLIGSGHLYLVCDTFFFTLIYLMCGYLEVLKSTIINVNKHFEAKSNCTFKKEDYIFYKGKLFKFDCSKFKYILYETSLLEKLTFTLYNKLRCVIKSLG